MGVHYGNYSLKTVELPINQTAILVYAEREDGQAAVDYKLLSSGYEYFVNFIYDNKTTASATESQIIRENLINTFNLIGTTSRGGS